MTRNLVTIIAAVLVICVAGIPIWRTASQLNERYHQTDLIKSGQNPNVISVNQQNFNKEILQETEKPVLILCYHTTLYGHQMDLLQQMARGRLKVVAVDVQDIPSIRKILFTARTGQTDNYPDYIAICDYLWFGPTKAFPLKETSDINELLLEINWRVRLAHGQE